MRTTATSLVALTLLIAGSGCKTQRISQVGDDARSAITYAARATYPGNAKTSPDVRVAAVDRRSSGEIELLNLSDNSVAASSVWVNGAFVARIAAIPPRGTTTVAYSELLEAGPSTNDFASVGQTATKVELQTSEGLFTVQGPAKP